MYQVRLARPSPYVSPIGQKEVCMPNTDGRIWGVREYAAAWLSAYFTDAQVNNTFLPPSVTPCTMLTDANNNGINIEDWVTYDLIERVGGVALWRCTSMACNQWQPNDTLFPTECGTYATFPVILVSGLSNPQANWGPDPACSLTSADVPQFSPNLVFLTQTIWRRDKNLRGDPWEICVAFADAGADATTADMWALLTDMFDPDRALWGAPTLNDVVVGNSYPPAEQLPLFEELSI